MQVNEKLQFIAIKVLMVMMVIVIHVNVMLVISYKNNNEK